MQLAAAPISWGVCEVPGWGYQVAPERVLADVARLGFSEIELGPPGFLPDDAAAARDLVAEYGLRIVAAFVTAVLHRTELLDEELASIDRQARHLAVAGGTMVVLAAAAPASGYDAAAPLADGEWRTLLRALPRVHDIAARHGLAVALHPHVGTAIETPEAIARVLEESELRLCLDTGHVFVGGGDPVRLAREYASRIAHVHLKDADGPLAAAARERRVAYQDAVRRGLFRPLGVGDAKIGEVLAALHDAGYQGRYVLEQDIALAEAPTEANDPVRDIVRSRDFALAHG